MWKAILPSPLWLYSSLSCTTQGTASPPVPTISPEGWSWQDPHRSPCHSRPGVGKAGLPQNEAFSRSPAAVQRTRLSLGPRLPHTAQCLTGLPQTPSRESLLTNTHRGCQPRLLGVPKPPGLKPLPGSAGRSWEEHLWCFRAVPVVLRDVCVTSCHTGQAKERVPALHASMRLINPWLSMALQLRCPQ